MAPLFYLVVFIHPSAQALDVYTAPVKKRVSVCVCVDSYYVFISFFLFFIYSRETCLLPAKPLQPLLLNSLGAG